MLFPRLPRPLRTPRRIALAGFLCAACTSSGDPTLAPDPVELVRFSPPAAVVQALEQGSGHVAFWQARVDLLCQASVRVQDRHIDLVWRHETGLSQSRSIEVPFWPTAVFFDADGRLCVAGKSVEGLAFVEAFVLELPTTESKPVSEAATRLVGGDIRSSQTLLVHKTKDLISFGVIDPERPGTWYLQMFASRNLFRARPTPSGAFELELLASPRESDAYGQALQNVLVTDALAFPYERIHTAEHITAGRLLIFTEGTFTRGLVLADADHDGHFDQAITANTPAWQALDLYNEGMFR